MKLNRYATGWRAIVLTMAAGVMAAGVIAGPWALSPAGAGLAPAPAATPVATAAASTCQIAYQVLSDWGSGFTAGITITNTGTAPVGSWTLRYFFPGNQQLAEGWSGGWSQSGAFVTVANASWNGAIPAGGSVQIGANFTNTGPNPAPAAFTLNGSPCNGAACGDAAPVASLTAPAQGDTVVVGSPVTVTAAVFSSCGVSKVTFTAENTSTGTATVIGNVTSGPDSVQWTPVAVGTYSLSVTAYDAFGSVLPTEGPVTVTVTPATPAS